MNFLLLISLIIASPVIDEESTNQINIIYEGEYIEVIKRDDYYYPVFNQMFINKKEINLYLDELDEQLSLKAKDATISETGEIIPEEPGQIVDREQFTQLLIQTLYQKRQHKIEVPVRTVYPRITGELLSEISTYKIGEYETNFNQKNKERSHNISLATEAINNIVIFPSEEFSFNAIVGERTEGKGYMKAPVIVKGELAEDIGGGICQVSSTLFNAVSLRGIQIVERYSHSREVPYVPPGKDAAVSWWGPDFSFKNNYRQPILIRAAVKRGKMHVQIFSSEQIND